MCRDEAAEQGAVIRGKNLGKLQATGIAWRSRYFAVCTPNCNVQANMEYFCFFGEIQRFDFMPHCGDSGSGVCSLMTLFSPPCTRSETVLFICLFSGLATNEHDKRAVASMNNQLNTTRPSHASLARQPEAKIARLARRSNRTLRRYGACGSR